MTEFKFGEADFVDNYPKEIDYLYDRNAGHSSALAYMMFRIGAPEEFWRPQRMDDILGRKPGQRPHNIAPGTIALLEQGAQMVSIRAFDEERYVDEGLAYAEAYHRDGWIAEDPDSFYRYWTAERVEEDKRASALYVAQLQEYRGQVSIIQKAPSMEDVKTLIDNGFVVQASMHSGAAHTSCTVVITDTLSTADTVHTVRYFDANSDVPPFTQLSGTTFKNSLLPQQGFIAVKSPA